MLNHQTKEKIIRIKESIENKEDVKEIEKKFFNTRKKKNDFLTKNLQFFKIEELEYINAGDELIDKVKKLDNQVSQLDKINKTEENSKTNSVSDITNELTKLEQENMLALPNEFNFFKDKDNLKALIEIVTKYKNNQDVQVIEAGKIDIPDEIKQIELNGNIAVKSNLQLYDKIKEMAYNNHIGIGQFITFILWDFYKRHK
ncbi:hypothetical protein [Fusobacterium polymorphum]|uniref:hypothetical protein n=1 Tax=Fusobacterium nucleatum subsp. polymorphum TaxID=76857 RepID=UPI00300B1CB1